VFESIKKRDGRLVEFDSSKITAAIARAGKATGEFGDREARKLTLRVLTLAHEMRFGQIPDVEDIQDVVERVLLDSPFSITAKSYILYREQHSQLRKMATNANLDLVEHYIRKLDWKIKENSNMCYSLQGLNNYISSDVTSEYWLNRIYPPEIRDAHKNGDMHIHDLSLLSVYCVGWDLKDLLRQGFRGVAGKVESAPPRHLRSALGQVVNFFYTLQGEAAGAQAISNFDTLLAPFVRFDNLDYLEVKQAVQEFVFNINIPTRVGFQTPFTNITMDLCVPSILRDHPVVIGGQDMEMTYAEFQPEMDMLNKAFAEIMMEGDARGRVFTFPIPTYNITPDFDWDNPNLEMVWKMTGKYGIPYFCLEANTPVLKDDHTVWPIASLKQGDTVLDDQGRATKVTAVFSKEVEETVQITLETGECIIATPTHRFPTNSGLKTAAELSLNDHLQQAVFPSVFFELSQLELTWKECEQWFWLFQLTPEVRLEKIEPAQIRKGQVVHIKPKPLPNENPVVEFSYTRNHYDSNSQHICCPQTATPELCRLLGYLVGDGYYARQTHSVSFVNADEALLSDFSGCLDTLFKIKYTIEKAGHSRIAKQISVHSVMLRDFLEKLGLNRVTARNKTVPHIVYRCSGEGIANFLRGLFDTDGSIDAEAKVVSFSSASHKLVRQVQVLLLRLGILSYRKTEQNASFLTITGNNISKFSEFIGFTSPQKCLRLAGRENSHRNSLGDPLLEHERQLEILLERKQVPEHYRYTVQYRKYKKRFYRVPYEVIINIVGSNPVRSDVAADCTNQTRTQNVRIVKLAGVSEKTQVVDISVDTPSHLFVLGSGIVSHNSNFVNSDMSPEDARSMCCRLRLDNRELMKRGGGLFGANPLTGSIGVVTINLPRIGYLAKTEADFFERLKDRILLARESLIIKRKILEKFTEKNLYPYSSFYLREVKNGTGTYWKNHFSTIGIIGMNEAALNFMGEDIGSKAGQDFALKVMDYIRNLIAEFQEETGDMFNLEATPAEGTSYRLAMLDKRRFPEIICANENGNSEEVYYTNSTQLPVNYTDDIFETLHLQDELQTKYTGGTVLHIYLGEQITNITTVKKVVRKIAENYRLPYFTLTPTFSVCPSHGYLSGQQPACPVCSAETEVYSRVVGYLRPVTQWNTGKQLEFGKRKSFKVA